MARPKKEKELKRNHIVTLRFNDTEFEIITGNAKDTELPLAEFLRRQVMKGKVIAKYEIVADVPELKKQIAEFGKIRSNLNQIAATLIKAESIHRKCGRLSLSALQKFMK